MAREQLARRRGGKEEHVPVADEAKTEAPEGQSLLSEPGWASHDVKRDKGYGRYGIEEGTVSNLIKFAEDGYFTWFLRHWVHKIPYVCHREACPLCARGDKPRPVYMFNVIDMTGETEPVLKVWEASPDPFAAIKKRAEDSKYSPINRPDMYFSVSKTKGDNGVNKFAVDPVKSRDLKEDFEIEPLDEAEYTRLTAKLFTKDIVWIAPRADLVNAAESIED